MIFDGTLIDLIIMEWPFHRSKGKKKVNIRKWSIKFIQILGFHMPNNLIAVNNHKFQGRTSKQNKYLEGCIAMFLPVRLALERFFQP